MGTESTPSTTRSQFIRAALCFTLWIWLVQTSLMVLRKGHPFYRAATLSGVGALGGLIAWLIYCRISGRRDGLMVFIMAMVFTSNVHPDELPFPTELAQAVFLMVVLSLFNAGMGWYYRQRPKCAGQANGSPLWDAQIDPPSS